MWKELLSDAGLSVFGSLAKGGGLGLAVAVLLLFICRRSGLFARRGRVRRVVAVLYYLYIPVVFAGVGAAWFVCAELQNRTVVMLDAIRPEVAELSVQAAEEMWIAVRGEAPTGDISIKEVVVVVVRDYVEQRFLGTVLQRPELPELFRDLVRWGGDGLAASVVGFFEDSLIKGAAGQLSMDPDMLRLVWDRDIMRSLREGVVVDLVALWINKPFSMAESQIRLAGIVLVLPVVLETAAAVFSARRRRQEAISVPA